ncbi:DUF397 domain-containing protein [Sphaerisporangium sp. NPDC051017]|uniref:DUF397 domain-containing protein n=1 Tax=Sphaerisporangium sp. NPDC051017 TaxID=3154636 RepID=UPI00344A7500
MRLNISVGGYSTRHLRAQFRRVCGGNNGTEGGEACVEVAPIPGVADAFALRVSKNPDAAPLRFSGDELRAAGMTVSQRAARQEDGPRPLETGGDRPECTGDDHAFPLLCVGGRRGGSVPGGGAASGTSRVRDVPVAADADV